MWESDDSQDLWATPGNSPAASMAHGERMVGSELTAEDLDVDRTLRPQRLDDYCGQEHIKQSLRVLIEAIVKLLDYAIAFIIKNADNWLYG